MGFTKIYKSSPCSMPEFYELPPRNPDKIFKISIELWSNTRPQFPQCRETTHRLGTQSRKNVPYLYVVTMCAHAQSVLLCVFCLWPVVLDKTQNLAHVTKKLPCMVYGNQKITKRVPAIITSRSSATRVTTFR